MNNRKNSLVSIYISSISAQEFHIITTAYESFYGNYSSDKFWHSEMLILFDCIACYKLCSHRHALSPCSIMNILLYMTYLRCVIVIPWWKYIFTGIATTSFVSISISNIFPRACSVFFHLPIRFCWHGITEKGPWLRIKSVLYQRPLFKTRNWRNIQPLNTFCYLLQRNEKEFIPETEA